MQNPSLEFMKLSLSAFTATALIIFCALTFTEEAGAQDSPLAKPLRKFDKDKDGKLTGDEVVKARQAFNRGGKNPELGADDWKEMMGRRKGEWRQRYLKDLDTNSDGTLDDAEKKESNKLWSELEVELEKLREEIIAKYDKNDDGDLTQGEREASRRETETRRLEIEKAFMEQKHAMAASPKPETSPGTK